MIWQKREKGLQNSGGGSEKKQEEELSGNYIYRVRGAPGAVTIVAAAPIIKHKGNQSVNNTNYNYEKLDIKEEEMLFLYTNCHVYCVE